MFGLRHKATSKERYRDNTDTLTTPYPEMWNPHAAVHWSLLFSPIFGAWLHAKNWRELNQPEKATLSMIWVYIGFAFLVVNIFLPDYVGPVPALILILAWYFLSGRKQINYVKENNITYEKKLWRKPILIGVAGFVIYFIVIAGILLVTTKPSIEEVLEAKSVDIVTQIVQEQLGGTSSCKAVTINNEISDGFYHATAYLNDGSELRITIELKDNQMRVSVLNE